MSADGDRCYHCGTPAVPGARFCGLCGVSLEVPRCASCQGLLPVAARFCGWCGEAVALTPGPPVHRRPEEELRTATILFALLDGLPLLLEERDAEDVKDLLDDVFGLLSQQIAAHGGAIDKIMADSAMALFGVPTAREDDAARAVAAALGMVRGVEALNRQLFRERGLRISLKLGINTGKVVAGYVGTPEEHAFTVLGDAVNVASRLEHAAPPGGILISETTRRLLHDRFRLRAWPALMVKGRAEPLVAHQVISEADSTPAVTVDALAPVPLVGRAEELDRLLEYWREVECYREVRWVTVEGELGQGKRRLLDELLRVAERQEPRPRILRLKGVPSFGGETSDLMGVFIHHLATARAGFEHHEFSRLEALARQTLEGRALGGRFDALIQLVADLAVDAPLLLCVDALHDADDLTLDFIEDLATELPDAPILILGLARPDTLHGRRPGWGQGHPRHHTLEVKPLSAGETRQLMARLMGHGGDIPRSWARRMHAFTGGNPFYITETVRSLQEQGIELTEGEDDAFPVPESIEAVIQSRIDWLSFEQGLTLRAAAVVGDVFWEDAVAAVLGSDRRADLARLEEARFIRRLPHPGLPGQTAYTFSHQLMAQVAYDNLLSDVRARYHRKVAGWLMARLEGTPGAYRSLLAQHLDKGGEDLLGARAWYEAADQAAADFRFTEATTLLDRAEICLGRAREGDERLSAHIVHARGEALKGLGRLEEARAALGDARRRWLSLGDAPLASSAALRAGWVALLSGEYDAVEAALDAAGASQALPPGIRADALHLTAELRLFRGDEGPVDRLLDEAEALLAGGHDEVKRAAVINTRGKAFDRRSQLREARRAFSTAVDLRESLGDIPGLAASLNNLGSVLEAMGDLGGAEICHTRSLVVRRRLEDRWGVAATLLNQVSVLLKRGFLGRARSRAQKALAIFQDHQSSWGIAEAQGELGRLLLLAGDFSGAREPLAEATRLAEAMGAGLIEARQRCRQATAHLGAGDVRGARQSLDRALALAIAGPHPEVEVEALLGLAEVALREGDGAEAEDLLDEVELGDALTHDLALQVRLAQVAGEVALCRGRPDAALPRLEEALKRGREHDLWPQVWLAAEARVRAILARAARRGEDPGVASAQPIAEAREILAELFARIEAEDLVTRLRKTPAVARLFDALRR